MATFMEAPVLWSMTLLSFTGIIGGAIFAYKRESKVDKGLGIGGAVICAILLLPFFAPTVSNADAWAGKTTSEEESSEAPPTDEEAPEEPPADETVEEETPKRESTVKKPKYDEPPENCIKRLSETSFVIQRYPKGMETGFSWAWFCHTGRDENGDDIDDGKTGIVLKGEGIYIDLGKYLEDATYVRFYLLEDGKDPELAEFSFPLQFWGPNTTQYREEVDSGFVEMDYEEWKRIHGDPEAETTEAPSLTPEPEVLTEPEPTLDDSDTPLLEPLGSGPSDPFGDESGSGPDDPFGS